MSSRTISSLVAIITLCLLIDTSLQSNIVDFQYTEYTQGLNQNYQHHADFDFKPVNIPVNKLKFPEACNIMEMLNQPIPQKQNHVLNPDIDSYLDDMKAKFMRLLTLTQKLANSEQKILQFENLINQTHPVKPEQSEIVQLQKYETNLKNLTKKITALDELLQSNITDMESKNQKYHNIEAKRIELDFKLDWLKQKITYLKNFEQRARQARQRAGPDTDYAKYFSDMEDLFERESKLISQIDVIIQKKDRLTQLRRQRANINASVTALELYIRDIRECNAEKQTIRKEFKNHQKIKQLIHQLKELKKNQEPNIYCEGVVKKLTQKIRTMVRYYAIVASCASDLEPKLIELAREKERLMQVEEKLSGLDTVDNLEDFEEDYKDQKKNIQIMYARLKDWKMKQFIHDPEKIAEICLQAEKQLVQAQKQKSTLIEAASGQPAKQRLTLSHHIIDLIKQIRTLKYSYCEAYQEYDSFTNKVWSQTYRYESEVNLKNNLLKTYREERSAYESTYQQMIDLRAEIYKLFA